MLDRARDIMGAMSGRTARERSALMAQASRQRRQDRRADFAIRKAIGEFGRHSAAISSRLRKDYRGKIMQGDRMVELDRESVVEFSRGLDLNVPVYGAVLDCMAELVVGTGLWPRAKDGSKTSPAGVAATLFRKEMEREADVRGLVGWGELQYDIVREALATGDGLPVWTKLAKVQMFEAERLMNPSRSKREHDDQAHTRLTEGIEVNRWGRPLVYHVAPWDRSGSALVGKPKEIQASFVLHLRCQHKQATATRGWPRLGAALERIAQHDEGIVAVHVAHTIAAMFAAWIESENPGQVDSLLKSNETEESGSGESPIVRNLGSLAAGMIMELGKGESIKTTQGAQPTTGFKDLNQITLEQIAMTAGLPVEVITRSVGKASFSAARIARLLAEDGSKGMRDRLRCRVLQPLFEKWTARRRMDGVLQMGPEVNEVIWPDPPRQMHDLIREAQAWVMLIDNNLVAKGWVIERLGFDPVEVLKERQAEVKREAEMGITPPKKPGTPDGGGAKGEGTSDEGGDGGPQTEEVEGPGVVGRMGDGAGQGQSEAAAGS